LPGTDTVIEVADLRKKYGELTAVDGLTFTARPGEIYGLLGPNGAGKSTTIGCISGLLPPTSGRIRVQGHDVVTDGLAARRSLGVVPQEIALYDEVSATENLRYWGGAYGLGRAELRTRIPEILELCGLLDRAREPVKRFSGGMKRRLNLACGVLHRPRVLLLDEPTAGVDAQSRTRLLDLVRAEAEAGTCVLYTTHYMEEAEQLCDRLAVIDHGRLIAEGTLGELRAQTEEGDVLRLAGAFEAEAIREGLAALGGVDVAQAEAGQLTLVLRDASRRLPEVLGAVAAAGGEIRETTLTQPSLESLFLKLTGKELRE
jgi:ABC-2 type transport system ATP-binding protein